MSIYYNEHQDSSAAGTMVRMARATFSCHVRSTKMLQFLGNEQREQSKEEHQSWQAKGHSLEKHRGDAERGEMGTIRAVDTE